MNSFASFTSKMTIYESRKIKGSDGLLVDFRDMQYCRNRICTVKTTI
jgi:hypothetical protein